MASLVVGYYLLRFGKGDIDYEDDKVYIIADDFNIALPKEKESGREFQNLKLF